MKIWDLESVEIVSTADYGLLKFTNWLVAFATPIFLAHSSYGAYFLFGGFSFSTLIVLALFMPETRGKSLEAIQDGFKSRPNASSVRLGRKYLDGRFKGIVSSRPPSDRNPTQGVNTEGGDSVLTPQRVILTAA